MDAKYVRHYQDATHAHLIMSVDETLQGRSYMIEYQGSVPLESLDGKDEAEVQQLLVTAVAQMRDSSTSKTRESDTTDAKIERALSGLATIESISLVEAVQAKLPGTKISREAQ